MKLPLQVSFRHMGHSAAIEGLVREKAAKLDEFAGRIMSCRVVVELKSRHHQHGNLYDVRINLTVPGEELSVTRTPDAHAEYRDIEIALHDAFDAAGRLLQDYVRRVRGDVKAPEQAPHGKISKLCRRKATASSKRSMAERSIFISTACCTALSTAWKSARRSHSRRKPAKMVRKPAR